MLPVRSVLDRFLLFAVVVREPMDCRFPRRPVLTVSDVFRWYLPDDEELSRLLVVVDSQLRCDVRQEFVVFFPHTETWCDRL